MLLEKPLSVGITRAGSYGGGRPVSGGTIPSGTRVDVYLVHFDPSGSRQQVANVKALIDFDRTILGINVDCNGLTRFDSRLGAPNVRYETSERRGVEIQPSEPHDDRATLSRDRQRVKLRLKTSSQIDEMRIVVEALETEN